MQREGTAKKDQGRKDASGENKKEENEEKLSFLLNYLLFSGKPEKKRKTTIQKKRKTMENKTKQHKGDTKQRRTRKMITKN